jgi:hypothetical protein
MVGGEEGTLLPNQLLAPGTLGAMDAKNIAEIDTVRTGRVDRHAGRRLCGALRRPFLIENLS